MRHCIYKRRRDHHGVRRLHNIHNPGNQRAIRGFPRGWHDGRTHFATLNPRGNLEPCQESLHPTPFPDVRLPTDLEHPGTLGHCGSLPVGGQSETLRRSSQTVLPLSGSPPLTFSLQPSRSRQPARFGPQIPTMMSSIVSRVVYILIGLSCFTD